MADSIQKKIERVRGPRVQITYDVEVGDSIQQKELPFVVGVMGDFQGKPDPDDEAVPLKERSFVNIDRDNFTKVLKGLKPRVAMSVKNTLSEEQDSQLSVELKFQSLEDFEPQKVVEKVPALKELMDTRRRLSELLAKMDGNDALVARLEDIIKDTEKLRSLK